MSDNTFGFFTGVTGFALVSVGLLLAIVAGFRMLWVVRRPGKGRIARGIAVGGLVLALCGALLFTIEEVGEGMRGTSDKLWHVLAGLSLLVAVFVGTRAARRPATPASPAGPPAEAEASAPEPPNAAGR